MESRVNAEVQGSEILWRRLTSDRWIVPEDGTRRVSSAAFKNNSEDGVLSVHIARLTTLEKVFRIPPVCFGVAEIRAEIPLQLGHRVVHSPTEKDESHCSILPPDSYGSSKKKTDSKIMAENARLIERENS